MHSTKVEPTKSNDAFNITSRNAHSISTLKTMCLCRFLWGTCHQVQQGGQERGGLSSDEGYALCNKTWQLGITDIMELISKAVLQDELHGVCDAQLPRLVAEGIPLIRAQVFCALDLLCLGDFHSSEVSSNAWSERVRVNRSMNALHAHAIRSLHTTVKLRRKLV